MARGSSLSDQNVIDELNKNFVAVNLNITEQGFPGLPGLYGWQRAYQLRMARHQEGFTTSVVLTPDGKMSLGTSGTGFISERYTSTCYVPEKYLDFLKVAARRYRQLLSILNSSSSPEEKDIEIAKIKNQIDYETASRVAR